MLDGGFFYSELGRKFSKKMKKKCSKKSLLVRGKGRK
jgi:hypothetical protein